MKIIYNLTSPLSHIGRSESTGAYFNKMNTAWGEVPVITGNHIRGTLRNCASSNLLKLLDIKVSKEVFHILFSGGNLSEGMKNDIAKASGIRNNFPMVSMFGGAVSDMILAGKLKTGFCLPICKETEKMTGIKSEISWRKLTAMMEFTRMDDSKNDELANEYIEDFDVETSGKSSTQMRYAVQYLSPGTQLVQDISFDTDNILELGAFYSAFKYWLDHNPRLGGMSSRGFGQFAIDDSFLDYKAIDAYTNHVKNGASDFSVFEIKKAVKKNGKKTNDTTESDSDFE